MISSLKRALVAAALLAAAPMAASAADVYSLYPEEECYQGAGGYSNIAIGNGSIQLWDSSYQRVSNKTDVGNGFFTARYSIIGEEGESYGEETLRVKITPDVVEIHGEAGEPLIAQRCR